MNCESVHTHWIVLCLRARRTSDDPDLAGLTAAVDGQPHPVCPETSSPRVITPTMKMNRSQGEIFFLYLFIHFLLKSAVGSRGSRADIFDFRMAKCYMNVLEEFRRCCSESWRSKTEAGGGEGLALQREMAACPQAARAKQDWTQMGQDSR